MYTVGSSCNRWHRPRCGLPVLVSVMVLLLFVGSLKTTAADSDVLPEALGSISGVVTAAAGQPISGVEVSVYRSGEYGGWNHVRMVTTDDAGYYVVPALRTGTYRLHLRDRQGNHAQEYYDKSPTLEGGSDILVAGNNVSGKDVRLAPSAAISGVVTVVDALAPDRGSVSLYSQTGPYWHTASTADIITPTGGFHFGELLAGTYRICGLGALESGSVADYFAGCYGGVTVELARSIPLTTGETVPNVHLQLSDGQYEGTITGKVTSAGVPVEGIKVSLYPPYHPQYPPTVFVPLVYTYTNVAGEYQLGGLADGSYQIGFSDPAGNYVSRYYPNYSWPDSGQFIDVRGGATVSNINGDLPRAGGISGQVRFVDGAPVASIRASLNRFSGEYWEGWSREVVIEPDGAYAIKALLPGTYRVCLPFELPAGPTEPYPSFYFPNCYGTGRLSGTQYEGAADISVLAGVTTGGIDFTIGPERWYAPVVRAE
jgi:hypothetical protein